MELHHPHITEEVAVARQQQEKSQPAFKTRIGYVNGVVWANGDFFNTEITKSYKDGETWKDGHSFGHADLMNVVQVAKRCEQFIAEQQ